MWTQRLVCAQLDITKMFLLLSPGYTQQNPNPALSQSGTLGVCILALLAIYGYCAAAVTETVIGNTQTAKQH